jgi:predicted TIM-barrel fold metal-dependent hydrolase
MNALIDTNVYLSRWPTRRVRGDTPETLVELLKHGGVSQAWVGSFEGLLFRDMGGVNERLAADCRRVAPDLLLPFGSINPTLPDWEDDLRRCHEQHQMRGIRLHPNYHGYKLDDPIFARLLALAAERGLIVQLALSMEDERTQSAWVRAAHVEVQPLPAIVRQVPGLKLVIVNGFRAMRVEQTDQLVAAGNVSFDIAMLEGVGGVTRLIDQIGLKRVVFGSYAPFFYFESSALKLRESPLAGLQLEAVRHGNAQALLA